VFGGNPRYASNARYFPDGLEAVLREKLGSTPLGAATRDVLVTAYDMASAAPVVFRSAVYRGQAVPLMAEVARATSAGPTYFPPVKQTIDGRDAVLADGGLAANNPALLAYADARSAGDDDVLLVSLGTGTKDRPEPGDVTFDAIRARSWPRVAAGVFGSVMDGSSQVTDTTLRQLLTGPGRTGRYWRLQAELDGCNFAMDDASSANLACLRRVADQLVQHGERELAEIAAALTSRDPTPQTYGV
jgi:predicted acylesterase/phospholipase RssA